MRRAIRGRSFFALAAAAMALIALALALPPGRPASAEPAAAQKKKAAKPKGRVRPSVYVGRLFRIVVEREPGDPAFNSIWNTTRCEYKDGLGGKATWWIAYQRIHPDNPRRATLWFRTTPVFTPPEVPTAGGGSGTIVITISDNGDEDDPTDPIPVDESEIDPCWP